MTSISVLREQNIYASDSFICKGCKKSLSRYDIGTDHLGRTVVRCPRCGPELITGRNFHRLEIKSGCRDCGTEVDSRAKRCEECLRLHKNRQANERRWAKQGRIGGEFMELRIDGRKFNGGRQIKRGTS